MSERGGGSGEPQTSWEAGGNPIERLQGPPIDGSGVDREESARIEHEDNQPRSLGDTKQQVRTREAAADAHGAHVPDRAHGEPLRDPVIELVPQPMHRDMDPVAARRAELQVVALFVVVFLAGIGFTVTFFLMDPNDVIETPIARFQHTQLLGFFMGLALLASGAAGVQWAKRLMPEEEAVQEREDHTTPPEEAAATKDAFLRGFEMTGVGRRSLLRRSLALPVLGLLPVVAVPLAGIGPRPKGELSHTEFKEGSRLVTAGNQLVRLGDLRVGAVETVFPEGHVNSADSATLLIRLRPEENVPLPGREDWVVEGHVAYSAICTHAGCPAKLYEQQTKRLLCPCHQSVFEVTQHCKPIAGPATRPLPQLALAVDQEGYFIAQGDFNEPIGAGFWERG